MSGIDDVIERDNATAQPTGIGDVIARDEALQQQSVNVNSGQVGNFLPTPPSRVLQQIIPAPAASGTGAAAVQPAAGQPGMLASIGAGLGHGFGETMLGAQQLVGRGMQALGGIGESPTLSSLITGQQPMNMVGRAGQWLTQDAEKGIANLNSQYAPYSAAHPVAAGTGNIGGMAAATAPLALAAPEVGSMGLLGKTAVGGLLGAANGAVSPVENPGNNFWQQKAQQVGVNAGLGAVAVPVTAAIGSALSGVTDAAKQRLADAGVTMTPGQILGGGWKWTEDKLSSLPLVGDLIKSGQQRAIQDFNKATYDQVLAPLGQKYSGPIGQEGVEQVQKTIGNAYDNALSNLTFKATDPQFQADITNLAGLAQNLPPAQQQTFKNILQTQVFGKLSPQGWMDGQTLKGAQGELGRIARGYAGDASFDNRQLGAAVGEIRNAIDSSLPRYNPPDAVQGLSNANAAYANFVRLRGAAASQGAMNNGGIFSPAQLQNAVKAADKSVGKGATATGNALMQDWSTPAQTILGRNYPDSGTAGRLGMAGAIGAIAANPALLMSPTTYIGAAPALAYTPLGQRAMQTLLMSRPAAAQAVGNAVSNRLAPFVPGLLGAILQGASQ